MESTAAKSGFGGFRIDGMNLGLPMQNLREVIPCGVLTKLPCSAGYVIGGIDLRGVLVPVIDLRIVLGGAATTQPFSSVIIMVHENKLLGLLTEAVTGVFTGDVHDINHATFATADQSIFYGSIHRNDDGTLVNLLSPAALAMLKDVPMTQCNHSGSAITVVYGESTGQKEKALPTLLLQCNQIAFAIDAMAVYTTLSDPVIEKSALAMGSCRGVIEHAGNKVPVLDLLQVCGLGKLDSAISTQAFILLLPKGMVAFLVNKVIDVVRISASDVIDVPDYALPRPALFTGALPKSALPAAGTLQKSILASQLLVLNSAALQSDTQISALADVVIMNRANARQHQAASAGHEGGDRKRNMITYLLGSETASPFEQIREILPFTCDIPIFEQTGPMLGMIIVRGRSVPVVCLSRLITGCPAQISSTASVLVVEIDDEAMGFAIPALKSIESVQWEPELPRLGGPEHDDLMHAIHSNKLAQIGDGNAIRMLPVLDLEKIARAFRTQQLALA
ncbi:hypothetical protein ABF87_04055 [Nitrosomonas sp. JL21]|uniref:chemotaxis protein CheW n=1 Tax=Nitrosomonas sp. JL21 TaxID=153949 RepID=UPI00136ACD83|nr:chemotaxis protein CheW [Nitrosomonas sp. JL21]MBL8497277.1 chemotaxis protein CheW [Nitrosomonas sp.]MCC7091450.1 chemotaxis protein CheW [Nitrosomonas sp.]MXS77146.1 hypothetical protein [Nitrosomonas sp. JL21]